MQLRKKMFKRQKIQKSKIKFLLTKTSKNKKGTEFQKNRNLKKKKNFFWKRRYQKTKTKQTKIFEKQKLKKQKSKQNF